MFGLETGFGVCSGSYPLHRLSCLTRHVYCLLTHKHSRRGILMHPSTHGGILYSTHALTEGYSPDTQVPLVRALAEDICRRSSTPTQTPGEQFWWPGESCWRGAGSSGTPRRGRYTRAWYEHFFERACITLLMTESNPPLYYIVDSGRVQTFLCEGLC